LRYRSAKKEKEYVERRKLVVRLLEEKPWCEACPVFAEHDEKKMYKRNQSSDLHELKRRSQGGSILDEENIICVCRPCHTRIGNYPQLAFDLGLAKHGWEN
jgi:5-methylcytosine-specific restriction endonuclease McrA